MDRKLRIQKKIKKGFDKVSVIQKSSLRTEAVFSDDMTHRYILKKEWDKNKPRATIIMINPSSANETEIDMTTMNVINNLNRLDYGAVDIVNMFSFICSKISMKYSMDELIGDENDIYIEKSALRSDIVIIAWGSVGEGVRKIIDRQVEILKKLQPFNEKMYVICDPYVNKPMHPLSPRIKQQWRLVKMYDKKQ